MLALVISATVGIGGGVAVAAGVTPIAGLHAGRWEVHEIGVRGAAKSLCVADPSAFLQWRHWQMACARFPLRSDGRSMTVQYTCPGAGHGMTTIMVEDQQIVRIQTQGIAGGQPFDLDLEARRTGSCS